MNTIDLTNTNEGDVNKENKKRPQKNTADSDNNNENKQDAEKLLSPPKKKLKQDAISFPTVTKEQAATEAEKLLLSPVRLNKNTIENSETIPESDDKQENTRIVEKDAQEKTEDKKQSDVIIAETTTTNANNASSQPLSNDILVKTPTKAKTPSNQPASEVKTPSNKPTSEVKTPSNKPTSEVKTPSSASAVLTASGKKKSPMAKEERQKAKELKEKQKLQRQQENEEKRKKREEEKLMKQAEKEKREEERKEKERVREEEKKRKEEEKRLRDEQKEIERRKKEEQKELELKKREAEKEKKEAERKQKEEERKQKEDIKKAEEEKKRQEEEAQRKKKEKAANQFKSFFTKKTSTTKKEDKKEDYQLFQPFQLKPNMLLAPSCRAQIKDRLKFDTQLEESDPDISTYLEELSIKITNAPRLPYLTRRKIRQEYEERKKDDLSLKQREQKSTITDNKPKDLNITPKDVVIDDTSNDLDDEDDDEDSVDLLGSSFKQQELVKAKFLQFTENTRPAYYGTWNKKTKHITGRKPFSQDTDVFNYDIDSDEEWIDEPGEDCSDVGDEDDDGEEKETEDDQDGFFVPHGYLSDDEGVKDDESDDDAEDGEKMTVVPNSESREEDKLRAKVCSFEVEFKKKLKPRKPICIGICYNPDDLPNALKDYWKVDLFRPVVEKPVAEASGDAECVSPNSKDTGTPQGQPENGCNTAMTVPDEAMEHLIRHLHGNTSNLRNLINGFKQYWMNYVTNNQLGLRKFISKRQLERKVQAIATRSHNAELSKSCYSVNADVLEEYSMTDLKLGEGLDTSLLDSKNITEVTNNTKQLGSKEFENTHTPMEVEG